jgi:hypothetical protein
MVDALVTFGILMLKFSVQDPRDDLHVAMRMSPEPGAQPDNIVIADKQQAVMGILWVIMTAETETMPGVQPRRSSMKALLATPNINRRCRYPLPANVCHVPLPHRPEQVCVVIHAFRIPNQ